jgi:Cna protein B-type domain.
LISNDDGKVSVAESKQVKAADNWQYSFDNLPQKDASGKDIIYSISEDQVPNYTTTINGFNITNTYVHKTTNVVPSTKSLTVKKVWNDSESG